MEDLDQINLKKADPNNMLWHIENFADNLGAAYNDGSNIVIPSYYLKIKKIVLLGMGGSGIASEIMKNLAAPGLKIPIEVVHTYNVPAYTDEETLVIASSYSGGTEEVLNAFIEAYERKAKLIAITTGGKLKILAEKYSVPCFTFEYKSQPRASIPYNFAFILAVFVKLGLYELPDTAFDEAITQLRRFSDQLKLNVPTKSNQAKKIAHQIAGKIPVIYATDRIFAAARRLKAQLNENSKNFSFSEEMPELNHNAMLGLSHPKDNIHVILLESRYDLERNTKRFSITSELLKRNKVPFEQIKLDSLSQFEELFKYIILGDFISFYLAVLNNVDPDDTGNVEYLKKRLQ